MDTIKREVVFCGGGIVVQVRRGNAGDHSICPPRTAEQKAFIAAISPDESPWIFTCVAGRIERVLNGEKAHLGFESRDSTLHSAGFVARAKLTEDPHLHNYMEDGTVGVMIHPCNSPDTHALWFPWTTKVLHQAVFNTEISLDRGRVLVVTQGTVLHRAEEKKADPIVIIHAEDGPETPILNAGGLAFEVWRTTGDEERKPK